jgi:uncharacterized protein (DUF58 family)
MNTATPASVTPTAPLLDPEVFLAVEDLDLVGRGLADAVWQGRHTSKVKGDAAEFHSHRAYQPGDDLRRINWALFARQRKLYTKESRQESRRPVYLLLDASASMSVQHGSWSKFRYASRVAAGIAHVSRRQGDAPALGILKNDDLAVTLPPRNASDHVAGICATLSAVTAESAGNLATALIRSLPLCRQRGFIILVSDFLENEEAALRELACYRAQGHDVLALQVLDPLEIEIPKEGDFDFTDPETGQRIRTSAESLHAAYGKRVAEWRKSLRHQAEASGVRWLSVSTAAPLAETLRQWLGSGW